MLWGFLHFRSSLMVRMWSEDHSNVHRLCNEHRNAIDRTKRASPLLRPGTDSGMIPFVHLVLLVTTISTASLAPGVTAVNVLVQSNAHTEVKVRQYLNVYTGFYLVLQPDCNLILYNRSQPVMTTNSSCEPGTIPGNTTLALINSLGYEFDLSFIQKGNISTNYTYYAPAWKYIWGNVTSSAPSYPYMILRGNGSCEFYDINSNQLHGTDDRGHSFLKPYSVPVGLTAPVPAPGSPNASGNLSTLPNLAYPFPSELAWKPPASLDGFPYLPAEYFLSQGSKLQTLDQRFVLMLGSDCNLQSRDTSKNGSESVLWTSGSNNSSETLDCELMLQQDGRLVIRNNVSGVVYRNVSTVTANNSVSWVLRLSATDGSLSISDIVDSRNVLWSNYISGPNQTKGTTTLIVVGVIVGVSVLAMAGLALFYFNARTNILDPAEKAFRRRLEIVGGKSQKRYSEAKVKQATNNFGTSIGSGGFGDVFYGRLPDGQEIAAKVLSAESHQSKQEFYNEIELLSVVHHKYLVSLYGYRCTRKQQILIYEYMSGGDLRNRLQGERAVQNPLSWRQRTSIAIQVAEGLEYLHDKCSPSIIHRDVKSTNILLTDKLVAKVADFGLSKLRSIDQQGATHVTTVVKGTPGYLDPEYHETGMLTDKSDVYAFGIVLMEILTGQRQMYIAHRVAEAWRLKGVDDLPDPNLKGEYDRIEFVSLVELSLWCVRKKSGERPFMRQVVQRLRDMGLAPLEPLQGQQVMPLDIEFENSEELARDTFPFSGSLSSDLISGIWRESGMHSHESGRSEGR